MLTFRRLSRRERWIFAALIAVAAIAAISWAVYDRQNTKLVPAPGGTLLIGSMEQPKTVMPVIALSVTDNELSRLIFSSLVEYNSNHEPVLDLAESYTLSDDLKTYTFSLRDAKWHDGKPVTADDVVFTVALIQDEKVNSPLRRNLLGVEALALDERTVQFTLPQPFSPFLSDLTFGIVPAHLWETVSSSNLTLASLNIEPVGSGPFRFKQLKKNRSGNILEYILERNDDYYQDRAYLKQITWKFYDSEKKIIDDLTTKRLDHVGAIPSSRNDEVATTRTLATTSWQLPDYTALFFNSRRNELLDNKEIRSALAHATRREELIQEALGGKASAVFGPLPEGYPGYDPELNQRKFDAGLIEQILTKEGWTATNDNGIRVKEDKTLSFALAFTGTEAQTAVAETIAAQWKEFGIEISLEPYELTDLKRIIQDRDYEILLFGQLLGPDPDIYSFWHSTQRDYPGLNLSSVKNSECDELLATARVEADPAIRDQKYREFQKKFVEDVPAVFLYQPLTSYIFSTRLRGVDAGFIANPADRFWQISEWYFETRRIHL